VLRYLGFVASVLSEDLTTSRTCRLSNATPARLRELAQENLAALDKVLTFLEREQVHLYRISSNLIPFASHSVNKTKWWDEFGADFRHLGSRVKRQAVRVSLHPGQFTVLNSPNLAIVKASFAELRYQAKLLDALGADASCRIVLHVGGLYGGSEKDAIDRFVERAAALPREVLRRLVIENDDRLFDADEVLDVSRRLRIPVVFDWLHHLANPCRRPIREVLEEIFASWSPEDGIPKIHLSSQAEDGPPGAHANYVKVEDLLAFLDVAPTAAFDCMLEAKQKDRALLQLRDELSARGIHEAGITGGSAAPTGPAGRKAAVRPDRARRG
jgi:UV DNA damage endonuclease